jgi:hypothetical protein
MDKKAATIIALGLVLCGLLIGGGIAAGQYLEARESRYAVGSMSGLVVINTKTGQVFKPFAAGPIPYGMEELTIKLTEP